MSENKKQVSDKQQNGNDLLADVSSSFEYGCPQCCSKNIIEIGNNHDKTNDEMEYLEFYKCLDCGFEFVE